MNRRALLPFLALGAVLATLLVAAPAKARVIARLDGALSPVHQNSATHALLVKGYAFDPAHRGESVVVSVRVDGHRVATFHTNRVSSPVNKHFHVSGAHAFVVTIPYHRKAHVIRLVAHAARHFGQYQAVSLRRVLQTSPSRLVVEWAKVYVGRAPYVWGGSSPSGFDCSGFAMYVYKRAGMRLLPHSAEGQRVSAHMRHISRKQARPGDLVFYLSGGYAYHVAVYAGHGRQYAAVMPGQRIRYQSTPRGVQFGTDWH